MKKKNNIGLIGAAAMISSIMSSQDRSDEIINMNDVPPTEPFLFTNPYPISMFNYNPILDTKGRKGGNNRKKIKRKKAKNGKR